MGLSQSSLSSDIADPTVRSIAQNVAENLQNTPKSRLRQTLMTILRFLGMKQNRAVLAKVIRASQHKEAMLLATAVYKWRLIAKIVKILVGVSIISASGAGIYLKREEISSFVKTVWDKIKGGSGMVVQFVQSVGTFFKHIFEYITSTLKSIGGVFRTKNQEASEEETGSSGKLEVLEEPEGIGEGTVKKTG